MRRESAHRMQARQLHRQLGLWASVWLLLAALTTLVINHRSWFLPTTGGGPYQQYILSHAICASDPRRVLIGTASGLFYSEDGARTFRPISLPTAVRQVVGVAFHPSEPSHLFAVLREDGIYSSIDGGSLWTRIAFPSTAPIHSFYVGFDGSLSVVTSEGLHRRVGETWSLSPAPMVPATESSGARKLVRLAYDLHDGNFWGRAGVFITDAIAVSLILLVFSGWSVWRQRFRGEITDA